MDTLEKKAIRVWMREVMESRNWSAAEWARRAGTTPTNITRFLKDADHVPSVETLAKLGREAGSFPNLLFKPEPRFSTVELWTEHAWVEGQGSEGQVFLGKELVEPVAVIMANQSYNAGGVLVGDVVVIERVEQPSNGQLVAAQVGDEIQIGRFQPPYLIPKSTTNYAPVPLDDAKVIGVVKHIERTMD